MSFVTGPGRLGWADLPRLRPVRASILVVDDDERARTALQRSLLEMGHTVRVAASAEEADARLSSESFHLALLDIELPNMNGVDFLDWALRRDPLMAVIMVTGRDDTDTALATMRAGARTYLVKPVPLEILKVTIDDALSVRELLLRCSGTPPG